MSKSLGGSSLDLSNSSQLLRILQDCVDLQSNVIDINDGDFSCSGNDVWAYDLTYDGKMLYIKQYSTSGNISSSSHASDDSSNDNILEEHGRISLAYENLRTIPKLLADRYATKTRFLDLSNNDFQNISFLSFFEDLHTLILDHNHNMDINTMPYLGKLQILWLNNCDIPNITDWIHRIQKECPILNHLSIMGNPGCKNDLNFCTKAPFSLEEPSPSNYVATNCRYYILQVMPKLEYLDGITRHRVISDYVEERKGNGQVNKESSQQEKRQLLQQQQQQQQCTMDGSTHQKGVHIPNIWPTTVKQIYNYYNPTNKVDLLQEHQQRPQQKEQQQQSKNSGPNSNTKKKLSRTQSIKQFFRIKRRKKPVYQSSSTSQ